ncbi:hypothetical protein [Desulfothermus sp.]
MRIFFLSIFMFFLPISMALGIGEKGVRISMEKSVSNDIQFVIQDINKGYENLYKHLKQLDKGFKDQNKHIESLDKRFKDLNNSLKQIDKRLEKINNEVDTLRKFISWLVICIFAMIMLNCLFSLLLI